MYNIAHDPLFLEMIYLMFYFKENKWDRLNR